MTSFIDYINLAWLFKLNDWYCNAPIFMQVVRKDCCTHMHHSWEGSQASAMLRVQHSMLPRCAAYPMLLQCVYMALFWSSIPFIAQVHFFAHATAPMRRFVFSAAQTHQSIAGELEMRKCPKRKGNKRHWNIDWSLQKKQYVTILSRDGDQMIHSKNKQLVSNPYASHNHRTSSTSSELF